MLVSADLFTPRTWYNLSLDASYLELNQTMEEAQPLVILKFGRGGHYDLLEHLVPAIQKYDPSFEVSFNNITKHLDVKGDGRYKIRAFLPLTYLLGLKANE